MTTTNPYAERRALRKLEKAWTKIEILLNRLVSSDFNPLYHLGTLGIFLLIVLTVTGIYLTIFYRPSADVAYDSVERITGQWLGGAMRSIHRYASDGLLLVGLLHTLKIFLSDRFWGSRWLAWVSGVAILVVSWILGTMGYWLVWDERAQWLTEYMMDTAGGAAAITFLRADLASSTFPTFIIIWFIHVFLPILILGLVIIHVVRLARARIWSPRWMMGLSSAALLAVSLFRPALSAPPADLSRLVTAISLDVWYLGFLPLIDRWGSAVFWGVTVIGFGGLTLLPWLYRGKDSGPALIDNPNCTGCALCSSECPYRAIEMEYRSDDHERFKSIAVINADLCTGCGLCVGTCATLGVEMAGLPTKALYDEGILRQVRNRVEMGEPATVLFTCQRHAALGGLIPLSGVIDPRGSGAAPVSAGIITAILPCVGMVDVDWVKELRKEGAADVILQGCPFDDCNYREGPLWSAARLRRRKTLVKPGLHWVEAAPGDGRALGGLLGRLAGNVEREMPVLPDLPARKVQWPRLPAAGLILLFLTLLFGLALPAEWSASGLDAQSAELRLVIEHTGVIQTVDSSVALPEGATVGTGQIISGERFPVAVQLLVDGEIVIEELYQPRGLRHDGEIYGVAFVPLAAGEHAVEIRLQDDGGEWRTLFTGTMRAEAGRVRTLYFVQADDAFEVR